MRNGEWLRSLELLKHRRDKMKREIAADLEKGRSFHRVRVVREPLSPYLQWELHALKIDAECGEKVRIVDSTSIIDFETIELLPEVVVLGDQVLYQIEYSDKGLLTKELRFKDASLIASWAAFIEQLYHSGEDIVSYFEKNVAHLPPPVVD